ncbi:uncharacterized protein VSU04_016159 isoform 1-T5 [Chlamydotis macqueenii]
MWNLKHGGGQPSGRSYRRGEKQKAASDLSDSPSSAGSESCASEAPRAAVAASDFLAMSGAVFHRGCPFLGHESTRWMERSRSGLQGRGLGAVSEHSCWLGLNRGTSAFSSAVLGSSGCGAAPGSHCLKGKGVAKPQAGAQSGWMKAATCHCGLVFRKT